MAQWLTLAVIVVLGGPTVGRAQEPSPAEPADNGAPADPTVQPRRVARLRAAIERARWKGVTPTVGIVVPGSGIALGADFDYIVPNTRRLGISVDARVSIRNYHHLAVRVGGVGVRKTAIALEPVDGSLSEFLHFPASPAPGRGLYLEQRYRRLPGLSLFGPDPSQRPVRTDFGQRTFSTDLVGQWQPRRTLGISARLGHVTMDPFPGTDDSLPNTESLFAAATGAALDTSARYVVTGLGVGLDRRDARARPSRGGMVSAAVWRFTSRSGPFPSFARVLFDAQRYLSPASRRHVLAARVFGSFTATAGDERLPFPLMQSLGGSHLMRSFHSYRLRGTRLSVATLESRWRVRPSLDVVPFADVGYVGGNPLPLGVPSVVTSTGIGARLWLTQRFVLRADVSTGRDGGRWVITFDSPF